MEPFFSIPSTGKVVVMSLTLLWCEPTQSAKDRVCADGSPQHEWHIDLGVREESGTRKILEMTRDGKVIFIIHDNGKTEQAPDFDANQNAIKFWTALHDQLPAICGAFNAETKVK